MPILDGYGATEHIREFLGKETTTIVAVSAYPPKEIEERATQCGMDKTISKPISALQVAQIIEKAQL